MPIVILMARMAVGVVHVRFFEFAVGTGQADDRIEILE